MTFRAIATKASLLFVTLLLSFSLNLVILQPAHAYSVQELKGKATEVGKTVGSNALKAGKAATEVAADVGNAVGDKALDVGMATAMTVANVGSSVGTKAIKVSKATAETAVNVGSKVGSATVRVSESVIDSATEAGAVAASETLQLIGQASKGLGHATQAIAQLVVTSFKKNAQPLLEVAIAQVDPAEVEAEVNRVRQANPDYTPLDLAHYLIGQRTIESSSAGSWLDTARFQAEMVYQVASAFGFDLQEDTRKKEIIEISAAALGSSRAIQTSMFLLQFPIGQIPVAGDLINMGINMGSGQLITYLMFQFLGNAACKYYTTHAITPIAHMTTTQPIAEV